MFCFHSAGVVETFCRSVLLKCIPSISQHYDKSHQTIIDIYIIKFGKPSVCLSPQELNLGYLNNQAVKELMNRIIWSKKYCFMRIWLFYLR